MVPTSQKRYIAAMRNVKRYFKRGNTYSLTHVTYQRSPILVQNIDLLWESIDKYRRSSPFSLVAWAILPDHWHCIVSPGKNDLATLMKKVKLSFAMRFLKRQGLSSGRVWQNRYWDHIIRDQQDLNRHIDYIHYNPVRHGVVDSSLDYPHSSFSDFVDRGLYESTWGAVDSVRLEGDFGE